MAKSKAPVKAEKPANLEDYLEDFEGLESGFEEVKADMLTIPFIKVGQSGGKTNREKSDYIEGLTPGDFYNSTSRKVYGKTLRFIPLTFFRRFVEWKKDASGDGQIVNSFTEAQFEQIKGACTIDGLKVESPEGNEIKETWNFPAILPEHLEDGIVIITFSSSTIKVGRKFLSLASNQSVRRGQKAIKAKMYFFVYEAYSKYEEKGSWEWYAMSKVEKREQVNTDEVLSILKNAVEQANNMRTAVIDFAAVTEDSSTEKDYLGGEEPAF